MAKLKDTEINGNLAVDGDESVNGHLEVEGQGRFNETLIVNGSTVDVLKLTRIGSTNASTIGFGNDNGMLGYVGMTDGADGGLYRWKSDLSTPYKILDSSNYKEYAPSKTQGGYNGNASSSRTFSLDALSNYLVSVSHISSGNAGKHDLYLVSTGAGSSNTGIITQIVAGGAGTTLSLSGLTLTATHSYIYNTISIIKMN